MRVLIVESNTTLGRIWQRHLERQGAEVELANTQSDAIAAIRDRPMNIIILDLVLADGSAFAVADFASYRRPDTKVIFVTNTSFFSDGSIFRHIPNACAFVQAELPPDDLCAMVEHYGSPLQ
ncbi:hypothetical protein DDZ14_10200 [Maritimibacter sp. 55A14]|uniref:response regulator transcription factor n=1 Tax=Maritimibacter sp. 55A14 TaxID=2174844 RepID=UPI000D60F42B|nr:response regulator [Maritimibacter sp. 55A14]PWE32426.1 hypothetical protein DDZ14_10200 [Maritimibacter sp. 55A14]